MPKDKNSLSENKQQKKINGKVIIHHAYQLIGYRTITLRLELYYQAQL